MIGFWGGSQHSQSWMPTSSENPDFCCAKNQRVNVRNRSRTGVPCSWTRLKKRCRLHFHAARFCSQRKDQILTLWNYHYSFMHTYVYIYINNHNTYYIQHILKYNIICILYMSYIICMYYIYISYIYNPNSFAKVIDIHSPWRRVLADLSGDQSGSIPSTYIKDQHWLVIPNIWCFHC